MDIEASREAWLFFDQQCDDLAGLNGIYNPSDRVLIKILDLMGREIKDNSSHILIYQYSDGSVEKRIKGL